jgi:cellulose synthase/poly-beta-1,6-N-acetylglucosamine synthase-like glycosyltransferase
MRATKERINKPHLSVVVPVYNSLRDLQRCLPALASSEYDNFDVLVVDDGSTEPIESLVRKHGFAYMRIDGPGGPARARNRGVEKAQGEIVVFIDADVCVHKDTLPRFAERFAADTNLTAVIGSYDEEPADRSFISQYKNLFHHYVHQSCDGKINTFWSGCGAMRRDVFLEFGGFDEIRYRRPAIEDIELGTWVSAAGHKIVLDSNIKAKHLKCWTLRNLLKTDIFDRGIPWVRLMLRAGAVANTLNVKPTQRISVALVYLTLLLLCASILLPMLAIVAAALTVIVTVLNLDFYRFFAEHRGWLFALCVAPLHWLYFLYCGFSVLWGTLQHYLANDSAPSASSPTMNKPQMNTGQ